MSRDTSWIARALYLLAALLTEVVLTHWTYHLLLNISREGYVVWDAVHVLLGVVVLPGGLMVLLSKWVFEKPVKDWRMSDYMVLALGTLLLAFFASELGYWAQETLLPLPSALFALLLWISSAPFCIALIWLGIISAVGIRRTHIENRRNRSV